MDRELRESVDTGDWDQFKEEIYDLYPGSKRENRYSTADLQALAEKQTLITIQNAKDYGTYHQSFLKTSNHLRNKSCLSDRETSKYFLQGLKPSFKDKIWEQLKAENPKHHTDDPYPLAKISAAALFVLSCNHAEFSHQEVPSIPSLISSQGKIGLIIDAIVAAITKKLNMDLQQFTKEKELKVIKKKEENKKKRMDKQQGIQSKKEPEVSSLKKSDSNIISKIHYPYINPINDSNETSLGHQRPDPAITIPVKF